MALDLKKIIESIDCGEHKSLLPVHLWHPERVGVIDILIDNQIRWFHEGTQFQRESLVKLLSSILRLDGEDYFLVTPQEKLKIEVSDVPFEILSIVKSQEQPDLLLAITNTEDVIKLDENTVWQLREFNGVQVPYVEVRDGLFARINRTVYYQLIDQAEMEENEGVSSMFTCSAGQRFLLGTLEET